MLYRQTAFQLHKQEKIEMENCVKYCYPGCNSLSINRKTFPHTHWHTYSIQCVLWLSFVCKYKCTLFSFSDVWYLFTAHDLPQMQTHAHVKLSEISPGKMFYFERCCVLWFLLHGTALALSFPIMVFTVAKSRENKWTNVVWRGVDYILGCWINQIVL